jgi:flagellar L-ring protein FlgH
MSKSAISKSVLLRCALLSSVAIFNANCSAIDKLALIGNQPPMSPIENPTTKPAYKPVQMPMPTPQPVTFNPNSLWRNGSRAFFKDQRAHQVGDILTVAVNITDSAQFANETQRSRDNKEDSGISNLFGLNKVPLTKTPVPGRLLTADATSSSDGKGSVNRTEAL